MFFAYKASWYLWYAAESGLEYSKHSRIENTMEIMLSGLKEIKTKKRIFMITDALGQSFSTQKTYSRIISLVPSTTETLYALGLEEKLVGVTRFCVHPNEARAKKILVGGTKQLDPERIAECKADLVIGNQEENSQEIHSYFRELGIPCPFFFPKTITEALDDIARLGELLQVTQESTALIEEITDRRSQIKARPFRYAYLIWRKPWMSLNEDCFISSMLSEIGGINVFSDHSERYFSYRRDGDSGRQASLIWIES